MAALALITANSSDRDPNEAPTFWRPFYVRCSAVNHEKWMSIYDLTTIVSRKKRSDILFMILIKQFRFKKQNNIIAIFVFMSLQNTNKQKCCVKKSPIVGLIFKSQIKRKKKQINFSHNFINYFFFYIKFCPLDIQLKATFRTYSATKKIPISQILNPE